MSASQDLAENHVRPGHVRPEQGYSFDMLQGIRSVEASANGVSSIMGWKWGILCHCLDGVHDLLVTSASAEVRPQVVTRHPGLIMQTPTTAQIRTAIQVLKKYGEHINHNAANLIVELPETRLGAHVGDPAKVVSIEQITRIQAVTAQLEQWRSELSQQQRQFVSHHD